MTVLRLALVITVSAILAACSSSNMAGQSAEPPPVEESRILRSNNALLYSRLQIQDMKTREKNGLMQVQATLENQWKFELDFQYKIKWFDEDGFEINPESQAWQQLVLAGNNQANVQGVAPNDKAARFEIWVRE
jgi:uncharacterized protein YcfL